MRNALAWGVLGGLAWAWAASRPSKIHMELLMGAEPDELLRLVAQVEREPELIPFVEAVLVEERWGESVNYRVETLMAGIPGWAEFTKRFTEGGLESRAEWTTRAGVAGFRQEGSLLFESLGHERGSLATLHVDTRFDLPLLGALLAHLSEPVLASAFKAWLRNLDRTATEVSIR